MRTHTPILTGNVIISVDVLPPPGQAVLVITESRLMIQAVRDFLKQLDGHLTPIWLTSVDKACERLEWDHPKMVIIDTAAGTNTEAAVNALHLASPELELLFLGGSPKLP